MEPEPPPWEIPPPELLPPPPPALANERVGVSAMASTTERAISFDVFKWISFRGDAGAVASQELGYRLYSNRKAQFQARIYSFPYN
jgi:hypothetical protein